MRRRRIAVAAALAIVVLFLFYCVYLLVSLGKNVVSAKEFNEVAGIPSVTATASITPGCEFNGTSFVPEICSALIAATVSVHDSQQAYNASEDATHAAYLSAWLGPTISALTAILVCILTLRFSQISTKRAVIEELQVVVNLITEQKQNEAIIRYEDDLRSRLSGELKRECERLLNVAENKEKALPIPDITKLYVPLRFPKSLIDIKYSPCSSRNPLDIIRHEQRYLERNIIEKMEECDFSELNNKLFQRNTTTNNTYVLLSPPGRGKTTLLKNIVLKTLERGTISSDFPIFPMPVYVDLHDFVIYDKQSNQGQISSDALLSFVANDLENNYAFPKSKKTGEILAHKFLRDETDKGHLRFFLDGLDWENMGETIDERVTRYARVREKIGTLQTNFHNSMMIISARPPNGIQDMGTQEERQPRPPKHFNSNEWELLDLCAEDIVKFVRSWFAILSQGDPGKQGGNAELERRFLTDLDCYPRLQSIASIPILLINILVQYDKEHKIYLPENRVKIYRDSVDILLRKVKNTTKEIKSDQWCLLQGIAWYLHMKPTYLFKHDLRSEDFLKELISIPELKRHLSNHVPGKWKEYLNSLISETGIFIERDKGMYAFACFPLQEFLAASTFHVITEEDRKDMRWKPQEWCKQLDPWYEEMIVLAIAMEEDTGLLDSLIKTLNDLYRQAADPVGKAQYYAMLMIKARFVAASPKNTTSSSMFEEVKQQLLKALVNEESLFAQEQIHRALLEIDIKTVESSWLLPVVQVQQGDSVQRGQIISENRETFFKMGVDIGLIPLFVSQIDAQVVKKFVEMTYLDANEYTKKNAMEYLLQEIGEKDRVYTTHAIGLIREQFPALLLLERLKNERDLSVCWNIAYIVGRLGNRSDDVVGQLFYILKDPDNRFVPLIRWGVANTLAVLAMQGKRSIIKGLVSLLAQWYEDFYKSSRILSNDNRLIVWQVVAILYSLGANDMREVKDAIDAIVSSEIEGVTLQAIRSLLPKVPNNLENDLSHIIEHLKQNLNEHKVCMLLLDILGRYASTVDVSKQVLNLRNDIDNSNLVYADAFYKTGSLIGERARSEV